MIKILKPFVDKYISGRSRSVVHDRYPPVYHSPIHYISKLLQIFKREILHLELRGMGTYIRSESLRGECLIPFLLVQ